MGDWKEYINYIIGDNACDSASILSISNGDVWASTIKGD